MSYLVLARKHRPQAFAEVVGQDHICDLLTQAISSNRIGHSYLFCGPRGVGKTTCARIFAMCLNCEDGPKANPDLTSSLCQEIAKGTSFDVLEIDGASNRGIDEIRSLRENVKFSPTVGRFKIYIVDEVHMLTTEAFNALLKTLEEPPAHVKFIFATTEPNKLPATIISRCQRFDFKRIAMNTIIEALTDVSKKEKLQIDQDAMYAIAKAAKGSMRDGLSILDQLSALSDKGIVADDVFSMLGLVETQYLFDIVDALGTHNCTEALQILDKIINQGKDIKQLIRDMVEHFRHLMVIKIGGKSMGKLVDYPVALKDALLEQTEHFRLSDILHAIELLLKAQDAARVAESYRLPLEVCFAQLTSGDTIETPLAKPAVRAESVKKKEVKPEVVIKPAPKVESQPEPKDEVKIEPATKVAIKEEETVKEEEAEKEAKEETILSESDTLDLNQIERAWDALTSAVSRQKISVATCLQVGKPISVNGNMLLIGFAEDCLFQKEMLEENENKQMVEDIFTEKLGTQVLFKFELVKDFQPAAEETTIQTAIDEFGGQVTNRWHNDS